ncbi:MAG: recombinase family protein [Planctomycetes bacterium]|nr:recombinase family protein [Planctomycetota bacterium]
MVDQFAVSFSSIRRATESGALKCLTLPSGHRRFRSVDVLAWLGQGDYAAKNEGGVQEIRIAACIRVSGDKQNRAVGSSEKSSLEHQEGRVSDYIQNRWGSGAKVTWFKSVGSGMNFERREFLLLIEAILRGDFRGGFLVATTFDRICRFGLGMVSHLCKIGGCEIVYAMEGEDEKSENESLTDEILSILTHYTAKASGKKNKKINEVRMDESQLRDAYQWSKAGLGYRGIAHRLAQQGRGTSENGKLITRNVVMRRLQENWATLERLYENETVEQNSFEVFAASYVRQGGEGTKLSRQRLLEAYLTYCGANGLPVLSSRRISRSTAKMGWVKVFSANGSVMFQGLSLNTGKGGAQ